jgi:methionyl aminopeptidase
MCIKSAGELDGLKRIGRIVRSALDTIAAAVHPGITTAELSEIGSKALAEFGAEASPPKAYGFPGAVCISVNDEAVHGVPGSRVLQSGDLVKLDLTAEKDGFVADAAMTVPVSPVSGEAQELVRCAERAFRAGARMARAGNRAYEIGRAVEREVRAGGFAVMKALCGHGVGRQIHEPPTIPNYFDQRFRTRLVDGLVITIEPIIAAGMGQERMAADGWAVLTADGGLSAHYEHTLVITKSDPILITA